MSQELVHAPATNVDVSTEPPASVARVESPPLAAQPQRSGDPDPRTRIHQLARELMRNRNRRLLIEFLQLRRALR
jgi:hypothetical protein